MISSSRQKTLSFVLKDFYENMTLYMQLPAYFAGYTHCILSDHNAQRFVGFTLNASQSTTHSSACNMRTSMCSTEKSLIFAQGPITLSRFGSLAVYQSL